MRHLRRSCGSGALAAVLLLLVPLGPAEAGLAQPVVAGETPSRSTPHAVDDAVEVNAAVHAYAQVGGTMYAGGRFRTVRDPGSTRSYDRAYLFSFDLASGVPQAWSPRLDDEVLALAADPVGGFLYAGGKFRHAFPGGRTRSLVRFHLGSGALDEGWTPGTTSGIVSDLHLDRERGRLLVSGAFRQRLAALDLRDGRLLPDLQVPFDGSVADNAGPVQVYRFAVHPSGRRLVAIGNFTTVGGLPRVRAAVVELGDGRATVGRWSYLPLAQRCRSRKIQDYLRDVDFSPDGAFFVIVATGGVPATTDGIGRDVCDAAARFETDVPSPTRPTWINYTGGDTLSSVAATGAAVYVGGHQRWLDNPQGRDFAGPGAVPREGVGALDPRSGRALPWNPGKTRGIGTGVIYPTGKGVWFGSDGAKFAGRYHDSIAFTPLP